jgi:hypothetical protein
MEHTERKKDGEFKTRNIEKAKKFHAEARRHGATKPQPKKDRRGEFSRKRRVIQIARRREKPEEAAPNGTLATYETRKGMGNCGVIRIIGLKSVSICVQVDKTIVNTGFLNAMDGHCQ